MDTDGADQSRGDESQRGEGVRTPTTTGRGGRSEPDATGFVWCEAVESGAGSPSDGGFEWGGAVDEPGVDEQPAERTESTNDDGDGDGDDTDGDGDGLSLDPTLVTTARGAGIDDEAVSLLAAFRGHAEKRAARLRRRGRESE